jgi:predicted nucleotidyltransferase
MNEEQALAEIVQTLTVDHGCYAVILYGSRARGDFQPTSDWDVAGIREAGAAAPLRVARAFPALGSTLSSTRRRLSRPADIAKALKIGRASVYRVLGQASD